MLFRIPNKFLTNFKDFKNNKNWLDYSEIIYLNLILKKILQGIGNINILQTTSIQIPSRLLMLLK